MPILPLPRLTAQNLPVDLDESAFGYLRSSEDLLDHPDALRTRLREDGYLYLRGLLPLDKIKAARMSLLRRLDAEGLVNRGHPLEAGISCPGRKYPLNPALANPNPAIDQVVFGPEILRFYERLLGGPVSHLGFKWVRSRNRGPGTLPHCDKVYMGRGTPRLLTGWIPYGEVPIDAGPIILLEGSHRQSERIKKYLDSDVDAYCQNRPHETSRAREGRLIHPGWLSKNPVSLREKFGGRWLTAHFQPGDLLTFPMNRLHASLDNDTDSIRLSTDTRYQLASEPMDERWIGPQPKGHGPNSKRGHIC